MNQQHRSFRSYWSTPAAPMSLGCLGCPDLARCGGQTIAGHGFNCLDHCCNSPERCEIVCPHNNKFANRLREVSGLDFSTGGLQPASKISLPRYVPLVFHGSARSSFIEAKFVSIPLYQFFDRTANCRFSQRNEVNAHFGLYDSTKVVLSGVARDAEVERWWKLGLRGRVNAISNMVRAGVSLVTTPNFSVVVDRPRWDDLHSIKRISTVYEEFTANGLPAALHVNGRTENDFKRWAEFILSHPSVTHIAFEFTTGTKSPVRMTQHANWLIMLSKLVGRRLGLVIRGGTPVVGTLSFYYDVTYLDTSAFERAQHRLAAVVDGSGMRRWISQQTPKGEPIDELLNNNIRVSELWFAHLLSRTSLAA